MLLQVSSQDPNSLPRLLEAYKNVAEILPTPTILSNCQRYAGAQKILALVYVDVLDFYQQLFMVFHNRSKFRALLQALLLLRLCRLEAPFYDELERIRRSPGIDSEEFGRSLRMYDPRIGDYNDH
jgi:hypothetical protein